MTSKSNKCKRVIREVLHNFVLPEGDQRIVRILSSCGNNLHQVLSRTGEKFLVSIPTKFRRNVWILTGDYVVVTPIKKRGKVKAEISVILLKEQIKYIQDNNKWPAEFQTKASAPSQSGQVDDDMLPPSYSDSEEEEEELVGVGNPNRQPQLTHCNGSADSDSGEEEFD